MSGRIDALAMCELRSGIRYSLLKNKVGLWKTINGDVSCQTLQRMQRVILTSGFVIIHDNAHLFSDIVTQQFLEQFKLGVSDHPAYSPDLATCDFYLFPE
ncbi:hypothetical protein AVEN_141226-1 [Araneus ventricosus]|uniref:Mariner Mos1 transposase n=1 Tax=Araneus ventricosus TaxID=182803 RepID=A0A4Y2BX64_ARAVE|nr:hypothetical protein AVEN_141226-1 [Araneus ventricosus]